MEEPAEEDVPGGRSLTVEWKVPLSWLPVSRDRREVYRSGSLAKDGRL